MTTTAEPLPAAVAAAAPAGYAAPVLDLVIPVYNEEADLEGSVLAVHSYLTGAFPFTFRITIADNASTDGTLTIAEMLQARLDHVRVVHLSAKGRGRALRTVWMASDASVLAYTDVDLSTDLAGLLPLVAPLVSGHSDLSIGTRLARSSRVVRGPKREVISRCYNALLRGLLRAQFSDAQCGFKAIRADAARRLLPIVEDNNWFFDTELLVLAERAGLRIHEVPVDWVDDPDSTVDIAATVMEDLRGIFRVGRGLASGVLRRRLGEAVAGSDLPTGMGRQLGRFAAIGVASTLAYLALFLLLRPVVGAFGANALALLLTAVANTAANRRITFDTRGPARRLRHHAEGLAVYGLGLAVTSAALWLLHALVPDAATAVELTVLVAANAAATLLRFVLFRAWVFRASR
jgi:putative flippase GtrA/glycosyltransferase involved in cell wall biosynthesis